MARAWYLTNRVGRRVVALFMACALLPVTALAFVAYRQVSQMLLDGAAEDLRREARVASTIVQDRLAGLSRTLAGVTKQSGSVPGFSRVETIDSAGSLPRSVAAEFTAKQRARVSQGLPSLAVSRHGEVILAQLLPRGDRLAGIVDTTALWGVPGADGIAPAGLAMCILSPEGLTLFSIGETRCDQANHADRLTASTTVFLGYEFGAPSWQVVVSRPMEAVLAPVARFRSAFGLIVVLTIAGAFMLASVQVRRRMTPLDALTDGTAKLSAGDLDHVVRVDSGDEFAEVASSFNAMAGSLRRQFGVLNALNHLDQRGLTEPNHAAIGAAALAAAQHVATGADVALARPPRRPGQGWHLASSEDRPVDVAVAHRLDSLPAGAISRFVEQDRHHAAVPLWTGSSVTGALLWSSSAPFDDAFSSQATAIANHASLALSNAANIERLDAMSWGALTALARTIDAASPWTAGHSERVTQVAVRLGTALSLSPADLEILHRGGLLHDIGKIGVPAAILDKPGSLTPEERATINGHPGIGARILAPVPVFQAAIPLVRWHHELLDGTGYPDGLVGDQIPFIVRVLTVADIYDALTSDRPYRPAWSDERALGYFADGVGIKFDRRVVDALTRVVADGVPAVGSLPPSAPREALSI